MGIREQTAPVPEGAVPSQAPPPATAPAAPAPATTEAAAVRYVRSEKTALLVETQDGDTVRLAFKARESVDIAAVHSTTEGGESSEVTVEARNRAGVKMSVQGELDADELAAIEDAFQQATQLAEAFFAQGVDGAFESAEALAFDAEQLARVDFRASFRETITYAAASFTSAPNLVGTPQDSGDASSSSEQAPAPAVESAPVAPPPVASEAAQEADAPSSTASEPEGTLTIDPALEPVEGSEPSSPEQNQATEGEADASPADPKSLIADFLGQLRTALSGGSEGGGVLDFSLKVRMFSSTVVTMSESTSKGESPLPEIVPQTLEAVAAQDERAPFDQVA